jgi:hypothetical protein
MNVAILANNAALKYPSMVQSRQSIHARSSLMRCLRRASRISAAREPNRAVWIADRHRLLALLTPRMISFHGFCSVPRKPTPSRCQEAPTRQMVAGRRKRLPSAVIPNVSVTNCPSREVKENVILRMELYLISHRGDECGFTSA